MVAAGISDPTAQSPNDASVCRIQLPCGRSALIDSLDVARVSAYNWYGGPSSIIMTKSALGSFYLG